jgi:hypothetical protein
MFRIEITAIVPAFTANRLPARLAVSLEAQSAAHR